MKLKQDKQFFVLAHNIRSLLNVGSIFRTSDSLGVTKLYLSGYTATPESNPKLIKTSLGAEQSVLWEYGKSAKRVVDKLKKDHPGIKIVGLENNIFGKKVYQLPKYKPRFPLLLVLGEETKGIPKPLRQLCDEFVEIPMYGEKESLNVSVAFGIAAFSLIHYPYNVNIRRNKKVPQKT
ncbi:MAG: TrmH family RNA methyltransferase [Candidatus Doudnabacteria bacterium]|nr:TrmH family RNA methyltransferase [Candidatus Doudnabacteria bacterium]